MIDPRARGGGADDTLTRILFGTCILALGVIFWLDRTGTIDARDYLTFWPLVLIAFGVVNAIRRRWSSAIVLFILGILFMPSLPLYLHFRWWQILGLWPLLISLAGVTLIQQALRPEGGGALAFRAVAVMGGNERQVASMSADVMPRGEIIAVMGGCQVDLTRVAPAREVVIDLLVFWGGVEIQVPRGWQVTPRNAIVIGALVNNTDRTESPDAPRLVITGSVIMGGVEVRNPKEVIA